MAGKAEKPSDSITAAKLMNIQTEQNYGLLRSQDEGAPRQRSYSIGTANNDLKLAEKLSAQGGVMLGSLGFKGVATSELAASGILDTSDYNCPRLYITNTTLYDLKVLIPTIKDGQELWIRNNSASAFNINNTSGTGNETTGNIELMAGTTYALGVDDWICFHYDGTDSKFKQVTVGKNNIGASGSGEVFTWTANHSAANFNLNDMGYIVWGAGSGQIHGTLTGNGGLVYDVTLSTEEHAFWVGSSVRMTISNAGLTLAGNLAIVGSISAVTGSANVTGNIQSVSGSLQLSQNQEINFNLGSSSTGNSIKQTTSGFLQYKTAKSNDDHVFYCGSTAMFRLDGASIQADFFVPLLMNGNGIFTCNKVESGTGTGNELKLSSGTGCQLNTVAGESLLFSSGGVTHWLSADFYGIQIGTVSTEKFAFCGVTPAARPHTYLVTGAVVDTTLSQSTTSATEVAEVLGTLIRDLQTHGILK